MSGLGFAKGFSFSRGDEKAKHSKGGIYKTSKFQEKVIRKREAKQKDWLGKRAKRRKERKGFEP